MNQIAIINPKNISPETFASYKISEAVRIVCQKDDGTIPIMYLRNRDGGYMLPGGGVDRGETHLQAAERELQEETGCIGKDFQLLGIVEEIREFNQTIRRSYIYTCNLDLQDKPKFTEEEIQEGTELRWMTLQQALDVFQQTEKIDSLGTYVQSRERAIFEYFLRK